MLKRKKRRSLKVIAATLVLVVGLFFIGYGAGIIPDAWIDSAETFFNGGTAVEHGNPVDFTQSLKDAFDSIGSGVSETINNGVNGLWSGNNATEPLPTSTVTNSDGLTVEFIDVGQADCVLIYTGSHAMLVDGGNYGDGALVADYLAGIGITDFEYVVATHDHEDHDGGLATIVNAIGTDNIMYPLYDTDSVSLNKLHEAASNCGATSLIPEVGDSYTLGDAVFTIIGCEAEDATNQNENSICIKLQYGDVSFLLTGDAESVNEDAMLRSGYDLSSAVYKAAHHGSSHSNTVAFLNAVDPEIVVISVGEGNSYGHPHDKALERFESKTSDIYRTDKLGTVSVITDGTAISVTTEITNTNKTEK